MIVAKMPSTLIETWRAGGLVFGILMKISSGTQTKPTVSDILYTIQEEEEGSVFNKSAARNQVEHIGELSGGEGLLPSWASFINVFYIN